MNKNNIKNNIKIAMVSFFAMVLFGATVFSATAPTFYAPEISPMENIAPPINNSGYAQSKIGDLKAERFISVKNVKSLVDTIVAGEVFAKRMEIDGGAFIATIGSGTDLNIGDTVTGKESQVYVNGKINIYDSVDSEATISVDNLKNNSTGALCANKNGRIILCDDEIEAAIFVEHPRIDPFGFALSEFDYTESIEGAKLSWYASGFKVSCFATQGSSDWIDDYDSEPGIGEAPNIVKMVTEYNEGDWVVYEMECVDRFSNSVTAATHVYITKPYMKIYPEADKCDWIITADMYNINKPTPIPYSTIIWELHIGGNTYNNETPGEYSGRFTVSRGNADINGTIRVLLTRENVSLGQTISNIYTKNVVIPAVDNDPAC